jgi:ribosome assembly protein RRB1
MEQVEQMEDNKNTLKDDYENCSEKSDDNMVKKRNNTNKNETETKKVFLPGTKMQIGEELIADKSAYRILHQAQTGAPCLSFDIIKDDLGNSRETYPLTMYILAGTQAAKPHVNNLHIIKMLNLNGTNIKYDSEEESSDSENEDELKCPVMSVASIKHQGCVNRVR